jgi:hypothetical protein
MRPPGKTTLNRMQLAAQREMERIEISQDGRVRAGMLATPMPGQVSLRDDFAGIVRLIDIIQSDSVTLERLLKLMRSAPAATAAEASDDTEEGAPE